VASSRSRNADIKLIAASTLAVLVAGGLIALGVFTALRGGSGTACPELNLGLASDQLRRLENEGPQFRTGGGECSFWLALDDGDFVAYKVKQPSGCTLQLKRNDWECGGEAVSTESLAQYPVYIRTIEDADALVVDLRPALTPIT
jgi:hypothetical protein